MMSESKALKKYITNKNLDVETLTLEIYKEHIEPYVPAALADDLQEITDIETIKQTLLIFFKEEDFIDAAGKFQPLIAFREISPKHMIFQSWISRLQLMFGSNKSGKSGNGGKKTATITQGLNPKFPEQPHPDRVARGWICNTTRALIEQTTLIEFLKWLRPDQYKLVRGNGGRVEQVHVWAPNGGLTIVDLKPYEAGVKEFESSNIDWIWCDEPPTQPILEAMWARLVQYSGWLMVTATTVQPDSKYLRELAEGEGSLARLAREVHVDSIELTMCDNKLLSRKQFAEFVAMYPEGTPMYKIRVMGQYADSEGLVFPNFITHIDNGQERLCWNAYNPQDFDEEMRRKAVHFALADYGQDDPFTYLDSYLSKDVKGEIVDYTWRIHVELYQSGLQARDQGKLIAQRIKEYGTPVLLCADKQILRQQAQGAPIWNFWEEEITAAGQIAPAVRANEKDKRDPVTGLAALADWTARINRVTGKPCLLISTACPQTTKEFSGLLWKPASEYSNTRPGVTKGKDHAVDPCRYIVASGLLREGLLYKHYGPQKVKVPMETAFY